MLGAGDDVDAAFRAFAMFTTLTNVNFNATRFVEFIAEAASVHERARDRYERAALDAWQVVTSVSTHGRWRRPSGRGLPRGQAGLRRSGGMAGFQGVR